MWRSLKKLKTELPYDPAIPLLGIDPKEMKTLTRKDICSSMFIAALFTIAKKQKQPKWPWPLMVEWIQKICVCIYIYIYIYIHNEIFSHKKEGNLAIYDNMDGHLDCFHFYKNLKALCKVKCQTEKNTIWSRCHMELKKKKERKTKEQQET